MKNIRKIVLTIALFLGFGLVQAQEVNTLYFLDNSPMRHYINPAIQPISDVYVSLPVIGWTSVSVMNNRLTLADLVVNQNGTTMWALNPEAGKARTNLMKRLNRNLGVDVDATINLLSFGFRVKEKGYFHFNWNARVDADVVLPGDLFQFALGGGMQDIKGGNNHYDLSHLGVNANAYMEFGFGYSHQINDQWSVGGKFKFLYGLGYAEMQNKSLALNASANEWNVLGKGRMLLALPLESYPSSITADDIKGTKFKTDVMEMLKPEGFGAAFDLGATYKPIDMVQITASVTDLGFIRWHKGREYDYMVDGTYDGVGELKYNDYVVDGKFSGQMLKDTVLNRLENVYKTALVGTGSKDKFTRMLSPRLNIGVDLNFWDNRVGLGVYSRTKFTPQKTYEEVTFGAAFRPFHWLQLAASYSVVDGRGGTIGAALGLVTYEGVGLTVMADYLPCYYAHYMPEGGTKEIAIPYKSQGLNVAVGLNIVIGHKRDKDKDGVKDQFDLCPETPRGVEVDEYGCPIDSDGDGVPDYLDECPNTPSKAYGLVDEKGCPLDTDGDSVPDYLDKCPHTPVAARGFVDENGCELDSDGDGVYDYLDECPATPEGASVAAALERGLELVNGHSPFVNARGCLLDTDEDGVPDYLDECPNTPAQARGFVDERGCELDTDKDGVPDWKDECPDTPLEAGPTAVDARGCLLDTDADGVPDYLDNCPTVAGDPDNHGCPVVKREIRNLLKKAMQGIQFETNKSVIKKVSYPILNQIAQTFIENPTFHVEVQGHTDNVGKPEYNMGLSDRRANAVRDYLIKQGVPEAQLEAHGYGDTMPIESNKTKAGRALNRRVEFVVTFEEVTIEEIVTTSDSTATQAIQTVLP